MPPDTVIKDFDIFKDTDLRLLAGAISFFADQFIFQAGKEGFDEAPLRLNKKLTILSGV